MKKFKKFKKRFISLIVMTLVMFTLMEGSVKDIFAIDVASEVEINEVVEVIEPAEVKEVITYVSVGGEEINYHEIKELVPEQLTIADGQTIEEKIKIACEIHGVPYDIAMAIARLETGHFKSYAFREKNNPGGLSRNEVPMSFDTIDDGVEAFVGNLGRNYISIGLDTPEKIGKKYCPVNPNWAGLVRSLMEEYD